MLVPPKENLRGRFEQEKERERVFGQTAISNDNSSREGGGSGSNVVLSASKHNVGDSVTTTKNYVTDMMRLQ